MQYVVCRRYSLRVNESRLSPAVVQTTGRKRRGGGQQVDQSSPNAAGAGTRPSLLSPPSSVDSNGRAKVLKYLHDKRRGNDRVKKDGSGNSKQKSEMQTCRMQRLS